MGPLSPSIPDIAVVLGDTVLSSLTSMVTSCEGMLSNPLFGSEALARHDDAQRRPAPQRPRLHSGVHVAPMSMVWQPRCVCTECRVGIHISFACLGNPLLTGGSAIRVCVEDHAELRMEYGVHHSILVTPWNTILRHLSTEYGLLLFASYLEPLFPTKSFWFARF